MKITHENGTVEYVTMERADEPTQAGTPINKALFDSIQNDALAIIDGKNNLSNIYNVGTYTTGTRTITDNFNGSDGWVASGDKTLIHSKTGWTLTASGSDDTYPFSRFVDGDDTKIALNKNVYVTWTRPYAYKLKSIHAKIGASTGGNTLRIGTDSTLTTSGAYTSYSTTTSGTDATYSYTASSSLTSFYMRARGSSSTYSIKLYELYSIQYETTCNILTYTFPYTLTSGTEIKIKTPSNLNTNYPTIVKIGSTEFCIGMLQPNTNYDLIYQNSKVEMNPIPVSIKVGTITDGSTIPQTEGYLHYVYFVSPYSAGADSAESNSYESDGNGWSLTCEVDQGTRVVTSKAVSGAYQRILCCSFKNQK